jgi:hypothetical protein
VCAGDVANVSWLCRKRLFVEALAARDLLDE